MNDAPVAEERIQNENGPIEPNETEIRVALKPKLQRKNALSLMS